MKPIKPKFDYENCMEFDNGYKIKTEHEPDCCEFNFPDWSSLDDTGFWEEDFDFIKLEETSYGFRINGYHVNCYSDQNGFYSGLLDVLLIDNDNKVISKMYIECDLIGDL